MSEFGVPPGMMRLLAGSAGPGALMGQEPPRRAAEWEREIESLDQKELELHQTQLKLIREQTGLFVRDLAALRQEVTALRSRQDAATTELLGTLEARHRELLTFVERETRLRDEAHGRIDARLHGFELDLPSHKGQLEELRSLLRDLPTLRGPAWRRTPGCSCRVTTGFLDGEEMDRKHQDLDQRVLAQHKAALESNAVHAESLREVQAALAKCGREQGALGQRIGDEARELQDTLASRLREVEDALSSRLREMEDKASSRVREVEVSLEQLYAAVGRDAQTMSGTICERVSMLERDLSDSLGSLQDHAASQGRHHATAAERLAALERAVGELAEQPRTQALQQRLDQLQGRLAEQHKQLAGHAALPDRLFQVEEALGDLTERLAKELAAAQAKVQEMRGRVAMFELQSSGVGELHEGASARIRELEERMEHVEQLLSDTSDQHSTALSGLKAAHAVLAREKQELQARCDAVQERLHHMEASSGAHVADKQEWLEVLDRRLDEHSRELAALGRELDHLREQAEQRGEGARAELQELHQELAGVVAKAAQMHGRLSACEKFGAIVDELRRSHGTWVKERNDQLVYQTAVQERFEHLGGVVASNAEHHAAELAQLRAVQGRHGKELEAVRAAQEHLATAEELAEVQVLAGKLAGKVTAQDAHRDAFEGRLEKLQRLQEQATSKVGAQLQALDAKVEAVFTRISAVKDAWDIQTPTPRSLQRGF